MGVVDEAAIENMSYLFFSDVLAELGHKLNYDAVVNYAGNAFCKSSWEMIQKANPLAGEGRSVVSGMMDLFNQAKVVQVNRGDVKRKYSWDEEGEKE